MTYNIFADMRTPVPPCYDLIKYLHRRKKLKNFEDEPMTEKKYRDFDLEAAKRGEPVIKDDDETQMRYVYSMKCTTGYDHLFVFREDGLACAIWVNDKGKFDGFRPGKLVMAPKKKTYWVNVYFDSRVKDHFLGALHETEKQAEQNGDTYNGAIYLKTISFEIEEE